jgi:hypothetical protein
MQLIAQRAQELTRQRRLDDLRTPLELLSELYGRP